MAYIYIAFLSQAVTELEQCKQQYEFTNDWVLTIFAYFTSYFSVNSARLSRGNSALPWQKEPNENFAEIEISLEIVKVI